jgi:hypothetical protein
MPEFDRLSGCIEWTDLSFVERQRTPEWAIQVGIRCHLAGTSTRDASQFLDELGVQRSHVAVHNWVHEADLQPLSTATTDQLTVDEKVIRINGDDYWLYGAVDPQTTEILQFRLFGHEILALEIANDHVHLFVQTDPKHSPAGIARQFKSYSGKRLLERYPEIRVSDFGRLATT